MIYRPEIDGLRAIAVLSVVLAHAGMPWIHGGFIGVDIFFVISGYLITVILQEDLRKGQFSITRFYERRARRILPALILVLVACIPFAWAWMLPWQMEEFAESIVGVAVFASNFVFWLQSGYFATEAAAKPLLHTWSLGVEEQFYLVFPGILWILWRYAQSSAVWIVLAMILVSFGLSEWGWRNQPNANFFLIPFRAWELLTGALTALLVGGQGRRPDNVLAALGFAMVLVSLFVIDDATPFPSVWALPTVIGSALIIAWGTKGSWVAAVLTWKPMVAIGLISYSAYLWHQPLFAFARIKLAAEPPPAVMGCLTLLTFGLAWGTWLLVEQPFRRRHLSVPRSSRSAILAACVSMAFLGGVGVILRFVDDRGIRTVQFPGISEFLRNQMLEERLSGIREGTCHYNEDVKGGVTQFIEDWSCGNVDETRLVSLPIGLYGDSHAADKAFSIRQAGFDVVQMTAAGCPLIADGRRSKYCDLLLEAFHERMNALGIREVFISNRFQASELDVARLKAVIDYWSDRYQRVYMFTPMPFYRGYERALQALPLEELSKLPSDDRARDAFAKAIAEIDLRNVTLLDTYALFCGPGPQCSPVGEASKLVDDGHLSKYGASYFGFNLVSLDNSPLHRISVDSD